MTSTLAPAPPATALFADRIALLGTENAFKIGPWIREVEDQGHRVIRCNIGEPDFPLPSHIREEVKRALDLDLTHYTDPQGILPLREAIARDVGDSRGLNISPARVVVFPGAKPPIGLCQQAYCNPGDEVIYPSPGFPIYESFTSFLGLVPVPLHLREENGFSFSGQDLKNLISPRTKLIVLNFPSNPTGGVATFRQLDDIARVIRHHAPAGARVYSDEVYEKIVFDGNIHRSIASFPDLEERTIIVSGVSKSFSWTGGRIGWAVFPTAEEAAVFKNLNINYFSCVPAYNQMGAKVGLESPESGEQLAGMVAAFQQRRDFAVDALNAIPGITCHKPGGAFYVFPNIGGVCDDLGATKAWEALPVATRAKSSPSTLFQLFLLFRHHVATLDRKSFGRIGSEGKHYLRLSIATSLDDLKAACARIAIAANDRAGFAAFLRDARHLY